MRALLTDFQGRVVRFPEERWVHIIARHAEMVDMEWVISETLLDPDEIYRDPTASGEVQLYYKRYQGLPIGDERICIVVRVLDNDAFVITAHPAGHPKGDQLIWTKLNT